MPNTHHEPAEFMALLQAKLQGETLVSVTKSDKFFLVLEFKNGCKLHILNDVSLIEPRPL